MRGKGDFVHLERIRDQCEVLLRDLAGQTLATFIGSRLLYDATVLRLFTIGEEATHLSGATQALAANVEWHKIRGLRNMIAHGYSELDPERVWDTAAEFVPSFKQEVERLLAVTQRPPLG